MKHKVIPMFGAIAVGLMLPAQATRAEAPESLAGTSGIVAIADGGGDLITYGVYGLTFAPGGNTFTRTALSMGTVSGNGTYSYQKLGPYRAQITFTGSNGVGLVMRLIFYRKSAAGFSIITSSGFQRGTIVFPAPDDQSGQVAPLSVSGRSMVVASVVGLGEYSAISAARLSFLPDGESYAGSPPSAALNPTVGLFEYTRTGPATAVLTFSDSTGVLGTTYNATFYGQGYAVYTISDSFGQQEGVLIHEEDESSFVEQPKLVNLSVRAVVPSSSNVIPGFVIEGGAQTVLIRAGGPALAGFGVGGTLSNPKLTVYSGKQVVASNDDWSASSSNANAVKAASDKVGAFGYVAGTKDAATVLTLDPGAYTVLVSGEGVTTSGEILLEVYGVPD